MRDSISVKKKKERKKETYRHVHQDLHIGVVEAHSHRVYPIIHHDHGAREKEEGDERRREEAQHDWDDHIQLPTAQNHGISLTNQYTAGLNYM